MKLGFTVGIVLLFITSLITVHNLSLKNFLWEGKTPSFPTVLISRASYVVRII
ncbi:hypothetical protein MtrunA17_Chr3g0099801 [Medicago truncatula]|uniref:Uncharacterized protein n=1 Tax=Medicago truncatula TaxID=3880 RepID=A0A396IW55_MEDTR|nr:hypothetical protein MtrunA17_Chr3g0099801 [Medicago truncatula]